MTIKGIDISHWNMVKDFTMIKDSGVDFVVIKAGGSDRGFYTDGCFYNYHRLSQLAGLNVGAYYFVGKDFVGKEAGLSDAKRFYKIIKGLRFEYPVFLDLETTHPKDKKQATDAAIEFCEYLEYRGYFVGIYASDISGFKERLEIDRLPYAKWVARYGKKPEYVKDIGIWQKSSTGAVPGIIGNVDIDTSYVDYEKIIKAKGFNGWR